MEDVDFPLMPPHHLMAHVYKNHRARFDEIAFGGPFNKEALVHFWRTVTERRDPRIVNHPMCSRERWAERAVPVALHGDSVPVVHFGTNTQIHVGMSSRVPGAKARWAHGKKPASVHQV